MSTELNSSAFLVCNFWYVDALLMTGRRDEALELYPRSEGSFQLEDDIVAKPAGISACTVVITGGSAGVGRALAHRFARAGNNIGILARDPVALDQVRAEIEKMGVKVTTESVDVAKADELSAAAARIEQKLGPPDIWINNAMETVFSTVADMSAAEFHRVTEVTYLGFVYGTMAALKSMRARGSGRIIQIGSALAYRGIPLQSAYCGAKHAIRGFTDSLRTELLHERSRIRLSMIELPAVNTPQFDWARVHLSHTPRPMGRPIEPEVVADAVYRAAQGSWREYWLGTPTLSVILGNMVLPGFLDRYLARRAVAGQQTTETVSLARHDNLMQPVTEGHRVRGSFGAEAGTWAPLIPGELARVGALLAGALLMCGVGFGVASLVRNTRSNRPKGLLGRPGL